MHANTVLILHADQFLALSLHQRVQAIFPRATITIATRVTEAAAIMNRLPVDLFLTSLHAIGGDVLDLLLQLARAKRSARRTLVVTGRQGARVLVTLCRLQIKGVFNLPEEAPLNLPFALEALASDKGYWSQCFSAALGSSDTRVVLRQLSPAEQLALALMGDGCSDKVASHRLGMTLNTVRSLRQDLHAKLDVHDKEGLQRVAARLSFTRFSEEGVVPVGAAILMKEYMESSKRPVALPPGTLAKYGMTANCALAGDDTPSEKWA